jgi:hypothetical protein
VAFPLVIPAYPDPLVLCSLSGYSGTTSGFPERCADRSAAQGARVPLGVMGLAGPPLGSCPRPAMPAQGDLRRSNAEHFPGFVLRKVALGTRLLQKNHAGAGRGLRELETSCYRVSGCRRSQGMGEMEHPAP